MVFIRWYSFKNNHFQASITTPRHRKGHGFEPSSSSFISVLPTSPEDHAIFHLLCGDIVLLKGAYRRKWHYDVTTGLSLCPLKYTTTLPDVHPSFFIFFVWGKGGECVMHMCTHHTFCTLLRYRYKPPAHRVIFFMCPVCTTHGLNGEQRRTLYLKETFRSLGSGRACRDAVSGKGGTWDWVILAAT